MKKVYMTESRVPKSFCPYCFKMLDYVSNVFSPGEARPGDFSICINCTAVLVFDENMQLKASSLAEVPIQYRSEIARVKMIIEEAKRTREQKGKPWST